MKTDFSKFKIKEISPAANLLFYVKDVRDYALVAEIEMNDYIDGEILQKAVDRTLERRPYFGDALVLKGGRFYLADNPLPMQVAESERPRLVGGSETNYHMLDVVYHEKKIFFAMFHSLSDGGGLASFIKTVLYYYMCIRDGADYPHEGIITHHTPFSEEETEDPYLKKYPLDRGVKPKKTPRYKSYQLPETKTVDSSTYYSSVLIIPEKDFIEHTKSIGTKPTVLFSLLIAEAIERIHPEHKETVSVFFPSSVRNKLGMDKTYMNCGLSNIMALTGNGLEGLSFEEKARQLKAEMDSLLEVNSVRSAMNSQGGFMRAVTRMPVPYKLKARLFEGMMGGLGGQTGTFVFDYLNANSMVNDYVVGGGTNTVPRGLTVIAFAAKGKIALSLNCPDDLSKYAEVLADVMKEHGFESELQPTKQLRGCETGWRDIVGD